MSGLALLSMIFLQPEISFAGLGLDGAHQISEVLESESFARESPADESYDSISRVGLQLLEIDGDTSLDREFRDGLAALGRSVNAGQLSRVLSQMPTKSVDKIKAAIEEVVRLEKMGEPMNVESIVIASMAGEESASLVLFGGMIAATVGLCFYLAMSEGGEFIDLIGLEENSPFNLRSGY